VTLLARSETLKDELAVTGATTRRFEQARNDRILAAARDELESETFSEASSAGRRMPLEEALVIARSYA
jgi:hypothetical protein